ncbi:MAG TPA: hypoxanthine phosphoribosyltransferase [Aggregatilineales bacterium]|nr:hypoxanthine phosphoribosyltransferase [Aggregatilineales bacterium]
MNVDPKVLKEVLIDEPTLRARVAELGEQISCDYANTPDLLLICVLKGGVVFLTDLMRHIHIPHSIDFMGVSSYGANVREASGVVRIDYDLRQEVAGRTLLIVEDIVDSGYTLAYIRRLLEAREPASIRICALLSKPSRRKIDLEIDYVGFEIADKFVFGYGLDLDEKYRNLPFIGVAQTGD